MVNTVPSIATQLLRKYADGNQPEIPGYLRAVDTVSNMVKNTANVAVDAGKTLFNNVKNAAKAAPEVWKDIQRFQQINKDFLEPMSTHAKNKNFGAIIDAMGDNTNRQYVNELIGFSRKYPERVTPEKLQQLNQLTIFAKPENYYQIKSLNQLSGKTNDNKWMLSPEGGRALGHANAALQNDEVMRWLQTNAPDQYKQLQGQAGKIQFANNNYGALQDLHSFQTRPLSWLISALFSRDPNKFYGLVNNINSIYTPGTSWNAFGMNGRADFFKKYSWALPWLNGAANLRAMIAGDDIEFKTPEEKVFNS